ncbi:MAG: hypothetical protein Fur0022_03790 [Anaerolineales bacterium]
MKKFFFLLFLLMVSIPTKGYAQAETLEVDFTRDWGYGGFAGEIQGKFSLRVSGPDTLVEVQFLMDNSIIAVITEPPFNFQFDTDSFPPGSHTLTVIGILADGTQLTGPEYKRVFLSADEAREATIQLITPILVGVGGITLLATVLPLVLSRKGSYKLGNYGIAGGAVCPRCLLPFSRNLFSPNMIFGKLERCPHCGKWAIVRSASPQELAIAEQRYIDRETKVELDNRIQDEKWKRLLDETRYE